MRCVYCATTLFMKSYSAVAGWVLASDRVAEDRRRWLAAVETMQAQMIGSEPLPEREVEPAPAVDLPSARGATYGEIHPS
jgi:hypothetical protein